jgi:hypothetical protein
VFGNIFSEDIHKRSKPKELLENTRDMLNMASADHVRLIEDTIADGAHKEEKMRLAVADGVLRLVRFYGEKGAEKNSERTYDPD